MVFLFAGLGLVLVGTILVGSLVFGVEPQKADKSPDLDTAPIFTQNTVIEREAP